MSDCAYCGAPEAGTTDHVPPKCLFPKPRPDNLITVPCCEDCREGTSKDDEYFWTMLVMRAKLFQHPDVRTLLPKVMRSLKRPQKKGLAHGIMETARLTDLETKGGLYLGKAPTYRVNLERMERVVERVVRGLYWTETGGDRLRADAVVDTYAMEGFRAGNSTQEKAIVNLLELASNGDRNGDLGDGTFSYRAGFAQDRPRTSVWLLLFYGGVTFLGVTIDGAAEQRDAG